MTHTWTKIPKATGSWTKIPKAPSASNSATITPGTPIGLLLALTYATTSTISTDTWIKIAKATGSTWTKITKAT